MTVSDVEGRALVVGVWEPGVQDKIVTVAIEPHSILVCQKFLQNNQIRPTIQGDIMKIPVEQFGKLDFTRVVFQGCCSIAKAMGSAKCGGENTYDPVNPACLANRLKQIMSKTQPGWVFFRYCALNAYPGGIKYLETRRAFIQSFENAGFQNITHFLSPCTPGEDIPDPVPDYLHKWEPENGGLVFFKSPDQSNPQPANASVPSTKSLVWMLNLLTGKLELSIR